MRNFKTTYLRTVILLDDISIYHSELNEEEDWIKKFRLIKNCFVSLDILRDSFHHYNGFLKDDEELSRAAKDIKKRLQLINHIRNKVSGHLEESLLNKAVQWEPQIFSKENKNNFEGQLFLIYRTLIESAINSYIDKDSIQKVFRTEIDLFYTPDRNLFFNFLGELNLDVISFLTRIKNRVSEEIEYWEKEQMIKMAISAGSTDFRLKK